MGRIIHFEIQATNPDALIGFYSALLDWKFDRWGTHDYWLVETGSKERPGINGGLLKRPACEGQAAQWVNAFVCTAEVEALDATITKAVALGAVVALPRMPIPGVGWLAYIKDPDGNLMGLMQPDEAASSGPMDAALVDRIVAFLRGVGVPIVEGEVPESSFLPGVAIVAGAIRYDRARLRFPGDLLHEAGHIAVTPAAQRASLDAAIAPAEDPEQDGEVEAIAWSFAAARALGLDASIVFHAGGYRGQAESLLRTFAAGVYPGAAGLERYGMTSCSSGAARSGIARYPDMSAWLRE